MRIVRDTNVVARKSLNNNMDRQRQQNAEESQRDRSRTPMPWGHLCPGNDENQRKYEVEQKHPRPVGERRIPKVIVAKPSHHANDGLCHDAAKGRRRQYANPAYDFDRLISTSQLSELSHCRPPYCGPPSNTVCLASRFVFRSRNIQWARWAVTAIDGQVFNRERIMHVSNFPRTWTRTAVNPGRNSPAGRAGFDTK